MKKIIKLSLVFVVLIIILVALLYVVGYFIPGQSGLSISSSPESDIYLDGKLVGKTPYDVTQKPGVIKIKLVPQGINSYYETTLNLVSGVKTIVDRIWQDSSDISSGEVVSFEKNAGNANLAVVTVPDAVGITIDDKFVGVSPFMSDISSGKHNITFSKVGFIGKSFTIEAFDGYKLTAEVKLEKSDTEVATSTPQPNIYQIEISQTPNGFLRVRSEASEASKEIGRVNPGEKYAFIAEDPSGKWYEIVYKDGLNGWVSTNYSNKISE